MTQFGREISGGDLSSEPFISKVFTPPTVDFGLCKWIYDDQSEKPLDPSDIRPRAKMQQSEVLGSIQGGGRSNQSRMGPTGRVAISIGYKLNFLITLNGRNKTVVGQPLADWQFHCFLHSTNRPNSV